MTRFADQIRDEFGRAVEGATIYVYVWDSVIEAAGDLETTLTNDIAVPLANPLTSDEFGGFYFNSADGKKLLEVHFGGELRFKELINIGAVAEGEAVLASTRTVLAAVIPGAGKARYLTEAGREGTFVFSTANLSALVAADTAQGVYVPPTGLTGSTGAWVRKFSGPYDPAWFGTVGDGVTNDTVALTAAITAAAGKQIRITQPHLVTNGLSVPADTVVDARGAVVTSASTTLAQIVTLGARSKVIGGKWVLAGSSDNPWLFEPAADVTLDGVWMEKSPEAGGLFIYARVAAAGFAMRNCRTKGSNGIFVEASNSSFIGNYFEARATGGDDALAIKGLNSFTRNIRIIGNYFENTAYFCSIGSEVGTANASDSTYSKGVGQIVITDNSGKNCSGIAFIKPGAVAAYDYRDGTVEDVLIANNVLYDPTGMKLERGIAVTASRGARVRSVYGRGNVIRGRTLGGVGRLVGGVDIYATDNRTTVHFNSGGVATLIPTNVVTGATSGATGTVSVVTLTSGSWAGGDAAGYFVVTGKTGAFVAENINVTAGQANIATVFGDPVAASITDVDLQVEYTDPYGGQTNDVSRPGYPATYVAAVMRETFGYGSFSNIVLDIAGNGSSESGVAVGEGLDDVVNFRNIRLSNVNRSNAAGQGGLYVLARTRVDFASIVPSNGPAFALGSGGEIIADAISLTIGDDVTALTTGNAKLTYRMPYPFALFAVRGSLATAQASGTILTVDINDSGTTVLSTKLTIDNTEKTSATALAPAVISDMALANDAEITIDIDQIGDGTAKGLKVILMGVRS